MKGLILAAVAALALLFVPSTALATGYGKKVVVVNKGFHGHKFHQNKVFVNRFSSFSPYLNSFGGYNLYGNRVVVDKFGRVLILRNNYYPSFSSFGSCGY